MTEDSAQILERGEDSLIRSPVGRRNLLLAFGTKLASRVYVHMGRNSTRQERAHGLAPVRRAGTLSLFSNGDDYTKEILGFPDCFSRASWLATFQLQGFRFDNFDCNLR